MNRTLAILTMYCMFFSGCLGTEVPFVGCYAGTVFGVGYHLILNSDGSCEAYASSGQNSQAVSWCQWEASGEDRIKITTPSPLNGEPQDEFYIYDAKSDSLISEKGTILVGKVTLKKIKCQ